jgi:hypothetical protein
VVSAFRGAVLECVVGPQTLRHAAQYRPLKQYLVQLALGEAQRAAGAQLDPQYKLPKMRYKGEPEPLVLPPSPDAPPSPAALLGGALQGAAAAAAAAAPAAAAPRRAAGIQEHRPAASAGPGGLVAMQHSVKFVGRPVEAVQIEVRLPAGGGGGGAAAPQFRAADVAVVVEAEVVRVEAPGCAPLSVRLPFAVAAAGASAAVGGGGRRLTLRLPHRPFGAVRWRGGPAT